MCNDLAPGIKQSHIPNNSVFSHIFQHSMKTPIPDYRSLEISTFKLNKNIKNRVVFPFVRLGFTDLVRQSSLIAARPLEVKAPVAAQGGAWSSHVRTTQVSGRKNPWGRAFRELGRLKTVQFWNLKPSRQSEL